MLTRRTLLAGAALSLPLMSFSRAWAAGTPDQAVAFVTKLGQDLTSIVNGSQPAAAKQAALAQIVDRDVDLDAVAQFCLGRFWRDSSAQQQKDYTQLFHAVLVKNITGKVGEYQGVTFSVSRGQQRDDAVVVNSVVTRPNNAPNNVDWLVSMASGSPKIIDVIAEGTSLRLTQRSDYTSFLQHNGNNVQALIDALRKQAAA